MQVEIQGLWRDTSSSTTALFLGLRTINEANHTKTAVFLRVTSNFHVSGMLGPTFLKSTKESYRITSELESILIRLLLFVKFMDENTLTTLGVLGNKQKERS